MINSIKEMPATVAQASSPFSVYTAWGEILRSGMAPEDQVEIQARAGEYVVRENSDPYSQYVELGRVVDMPVRPSDKHVFDYMQRTWIDLRPLPDLKAAKWQEVKQARDDAEFGGFAWDSSHFDSDAVSQSRLRGAALEAVRSPAFSRLWTLADNTARQLHAPDMAAVVTALDDHIARQHAVARELRTQINAATTAAQLAGIHWPIAIV